MKLAGDVILEICSRYCSEILCRHKLSGYFKVRKLGEREFLELTLAADERKSITRYLHEVLRGLSEANEVEDLTSVILKGRSLEVRLSSRKSFWYRLGLALSDGSLLGKAEIIFSTTKPHTLNAVLYSFGGALLYIAKCMRYMRSERVACVVNALVHDEGVAAEIIRLRECCSEIENIIDTLRSCRDCLVQFMAGVIDGDGTIDKDSVRVSIHEEDILFRIIKELIDNVKYDAKKYLLRISTYSLRKRNILNELADQVISSNKKSKLLNLMNKRTRFNSRQLEREITKINESTISKVAESLTEGEIMLLRQIKLRKKGSYTYAFISCPSRILPNVYGELKAVMHKLSLKLGIDIDLASSVKVGNREVVIYSKHVVNLLREILKALHR